MCRDRVTRGVRMQLLRVTALAVAICVLAPPPVSAQISPNAAWSCEFANSATACGFYLQAAASNRAAVVGPGRDGSTAIELTTHLGDINIDRKSTRLNSSHPSISYAVFCLKKKKKKDVTHNDYR